jgi:hypothetical protein
MPCQISNHLHYGPLPIASDFGFRLGMHLELLLTFLNLVKITTVYRKVGVVFGVLVRVSNLILLKPMHFLSCR